MDLNLKQKVALISGGTHGIGRSIALTLAAEGCRVAVFSSTDAKVRTMEKELAAAGADSLAMKADAMRADELEAVEKAVIAKWGTVHILVNNVGGGGRWGKETVEDTDERVWTEVYEKNVLSSIRLTRWALPFMRAQTWGRVIAITSIFGREGGGRPWFAMAKTAQTAMMKALALKPYLSAENITFNSVAPGALMIPDTGWDHEARENPARFAEFVKKECPRGKLGAPEDVARLVAFLCSDGAAHINGVSVPVDGGQSRSLL